MQKQKKKYLLSPWVTLNNPIIKFPLNEYSVKHKGYYKTRRATVYNFTITIFKAYLVRILKALLTKKLQATA